MHIIMNGIVCCCFDFDFGFCGRGGVVLKI